MMISRRGFASWFASRAAALSLGVGLGLAPALAEPIKIAHAKGETTLPATPRKVIVFDLASLDTLDALGVSVAGVPGGNRPRYLAKYDADSYAKVGTLFEPNYEAVAAVGPDLIIVGGRSGAKYEQLAKLAPTIDLTSDAKDPYGSVQRNVATLGRIFGKEGEAKARLDRLQGSVDALKAKAPSVGKGLLVLTTGGKMSAYGPGSRFGLLHEFGVAPAVTDLKVGRHGQPVSFEFIRKANPDWLFVIDRDAAIGREGAAAKLLDNELVAQTTAWKKKQVVYLDPVNWYLVGGGLTAMQATVDQLVQAFAGAN
ncbi:siderophore ABC transporter substrate-binding protein [Bosea minatitlanensis]